MDHGSSAARVVNGGRGAASVLLSLTGLTTLAVAQPLLDLLGRNAAFLVAHGVQGTGVVALTGGLTFGLPIAAGAVILGVRRISRRSAVLLHDATIALLATAGILVALRVGGMGSRLLAAGEIALAVCGAAGATLAYHRSSVIRRVVNVSALAAPIALLLFLLATPARTLLVPPRADVGDVDVSRDAAPVVLVVFDELPLSSLLNEDYVVDRTTYPAFAQLADDATFFRNVTGSHSATFEAVPALLSGRYADTDTLPTSALHPTNLFSLLADTYELHALEPLTDLCSGCAPTSRSKADVATLVRDLGVVLLHLVVPDDLAGRLPPLDVGWRDFGDGDDEVLGRERFRERADVALRDDIPADFVTFTREISRSSAPTLHVLHTLLPHRPWRYLPDGRIHLGMADVAVGDHWPRHPWAAAHGLQLHYAQTQFADRLLGRLMRHLEAVGMYEESLLVVVADHGLSLVPGTPTRKVTEETLYDIATVPLFVKVPGQTRGVVSDRPLETIDVVPTILDVIDVHPPQRLDGRSAFEETAPQRETKRLMDPDGRTWEFEASQARVFEAVRRKFELFGRGGEFDLYGLGPPGAEELIGEPIPPRLPTAGGRVVHLARRSEYVDVDPSSPVVPAFVAGRVEGLPGDVAQPVVAIAVNGVIRAVTVADTGTPHHGRFRAMVPPTAFTEGRNEIDVLSFEGSGELAVIPRAPNETG